ncbi:MAG: hypothetical protein L6414_02155 [Hydrogenophaga sp.]|nr:hypothetical protein [Hydrogenophaga sp.]MCG2654251.1 hypothetical protein [Hydrogenophaga sp.]
MSNPTLGRRYLVLLGFAVAALPALAQAQDLYQGITKVEVFANSAMVITPIQADR